jgi:hypothetical protein
LVRHEGLHRLLDCVGRDDYGDHTNDVFMCSEGSSFTLWGAPGSLVREAEYIVTAYSCNE